MTKNVGLNKWGKLKFFLLFHGFSHEKNSKIKPLHSEPRMRLCCLTRPYKKIIWPNLGTKFIFNLISVHPELKIGKLADFEGRKIIQVYRGYTYIADWCVNCLSFLNLMLPHLITAVSIFGLSSTIYGQCWCVFEGYFLCLLKNCIQDISVDPPFCGSFCGGSKSLPDEWRICIHCT